MHMYMRYFVSAPPRRVRLYGITVDSSHVRQATSWHANYFVRKKENVMPSHTVRVRVRGKKMHM